MPVDNILLQEGVITRLLGGLATTVHIGLISVALSIPLGILVGLFMTSNNKVVRAILRVYLEIVRVMPQLVLLFVVFFGTSEWFDVNFDGIEASIVVFTFWERPNLEIWYEERWSQFQRLSMTVRLYLAFLANRRFLRSSYLRLSSVFCLQLSI